MYVFMCELMGYFLPDGLMSQATYIDGLLYLPAYELAEYLGGVCSILIGFGLFSFFTLQLLIDLVLWLWRKLRSIRLS